MICGTGRRDIEVPDGTSMGIAEFLKTVSGMPPGGITERTSAEILVILILLNELKREFAQEYSAVIIKDFFFR